MKRLKIIFSLLFALGINEASLAETAILPLPEGTPVEVDGYSSRAMYHEYLASIDKDIKDSSRRALAGIKIVPLKYKGAHKIHNHGVRFRYYPEDQPSQNVKAMGQVFHSCDREGNNCDWVMKIVSVPIILSLDWASENFDAPTAASNLKARDIRPDDNILGLLMDLPSPSEHILTNTEKQLYFGKECPAFLNILGSNFYAQERARYLLNVSTKDIDIPTSKHVKRAVFEFAIAENAGALKVYHAQPVIELKLSNEFGDEIGNKLFESTKQCPNRANP